MNNTNVLLYVAAIELAYIFFLPPAAHHKRSWNTGKNSFPWFQVTLFFRVLAHSALYMTGKNGVLNGQFSRSAQRNTNPDGGIKQTWERKLEMRFRGKQNFFVAHKLNENCQRYFKSWIKVQEYQILHSSIFHIS